MFEPWIIACVATIGLFAGVVGGMTGIGGSLIMIPGLVMLFGQGAGRPGAAGEFAPMNQHLYQAAAMIVNVFVAIPATVRHVQAGAIVGAVLRWMIPSSFAAILLGVWASNARWFEQDNGLGVSGPVLLGRVLAAFMFYTAAMNLKRMFRPARATDEPVDLSHVTPMRCAAVGGATGFVGGLLGLGGGGVAVPLQQVLLKLRLRNCIANSAASMCVTSVVGAAYKNATLAEHHLDWNRSILLAALLAPTAMVGGYFGGMLTHRLPVKAVRLGIIVLMLAAGWKMAAVG
jgi:hypothetical protein